MARVTVEDCIDKVDSPYELVLVAKERATQLNSGLEPTIDRDNDKNTVIALREIAEESIKVPDLTEAAVYKLRKHVEQIDDTWEDEEDIGEDFENLYKGEISKSGVPILPSKRARKIPEKIQVSKDDLADSAIYKLRKQVEQTDDVAEEDEEIGDDFENLYKGEISKSGTPILPSKRARKAPEKIQVSKEDLAELSQTEQPNIETPSTEENEGGQSDVSLEEVSESENQATEVKYEDSDTSNS